MENNKDHQQFLSDELSRARWAIQDLEETLERQKGLRGSFRHFSKEAKDSILFTLRRIYHTHFSGLRKRIQAEAARNSRFKPYAIKYRQTVPHKRKRILHAIPSFATGGSQQLIIDIIEGTDEAYEHLIITHNDWGVQSYTGVPLLELPYVRDKEAITAILKKYNPDIVHVHYWGNRQGGYAHWMWYHHIFEAAFSRGCRVIENCNNPLVPYLHKKIDRYVFVSNYAKAYFGTGESREMVIYPGSNFSLFEKAQNNPKPADTIGMVYRLDSDKLNEASIDVFIRVIQRRPQTRALIVGQGRFEQLYRSKVAEAGLSDAIEFSGMVAYEALPEYYSRMSLFVTPVHKESFGQITPFAMNMGLPVAGYNVGALQEILGSDGTLAPAGDIEALAGLIIGLLDDPARMQALSAGNRARAQALFSLPTMVRDYEALYERLTGDTDAPL